MLITVRHLLVLLLLVSGALGVGAAAGHGLGLGEEWAIPVVAVTSILVFALAGGPLFRLLSLRPLILPLCPDCGNRHANYHVPREAWPVAVLFCATCGKPLRLVLRGSAAPADIPSVTLRWPGFLGLWRP